MHPFWCSRRLIPVFNFIMPLHYFTGSVLPKLGPTKFDAVISNPPYVLEDDMLQLQPEISK